MLSVLTKIAEIASEFGTTLPNKTMRWFYTNKNSLSPHQPNYNSIKSWVGYNHNPIPPETWGDWYWIEQYQCSGTTRQKRQQRNSSLGNHQYRWVTWEVNSVTCGYAPPKIINVNVGIVGPNAGRFQYSYIIVNNVTINNGESKNITVIGNSMTISSDWGFGSDWKLSGDAALSYNPSSGYSSNLSSRVKYEGFSGDATQITLFLGRM